MDSPNMQQTGSTCSGSAGVRSPHGTHSVVDDLEPSHEENNLGSKLHHLDSGEQTPGQQEEKPHPATPAYTPHPPTPPPPGVELNTVGADYWTNLLLTQQRQNQLLEQQAEQQRAHFELLQRHLHFQTAISNQAASVFQELNDFQFSPTTASGLQESPSTIRIQPSNQAPNNFSGAHSGGHASLNPASVDDNAANHQNSREDNTPRILIFTAVNAQSSASNGIMMAGGDVAAQPGNSNTPLESAPDTVMEDVEGVPMHSDLPSQFQGHLFVPDGYFLFEETPFGDTSPVSQMTTSCMDIREAVKNEEAQEETVKQLYAETYARDVQTLCSMLPRNQLERVIVDVATFEQGVSPPMSLKDHVRDILIKRVQQRRPRISINQFNTSIFAPSVAANNAARALKMYGSIGYFNKLPLDSILNVISLLPFQTAVLMVQRVCRTFRHFAEYPQLWNSIPIETTMGEHDFNIRGFIRFLKSLPENSIRMLTFDTGFIDHTSHTEVLDVLTRTKQFNIRSLHIIGKRTTIGTLNGMFRRIWADKITVLSITEVVQSKVDTDTLIKNCLLLVPNIQKLRIQGPISADAFLALSSVRGQMKDEDGSPLVGDNHITHLSLPKAILEWETVSHFGKWFPELESLNICSLVGNEDWQTKYVTISQEGSSYRYPTMEEVSWQSMRRLKHFSLQNIGDHAKKQLVKDQEVVYMAFLWAMIRASESTLERLEISRGEQTLPYAARKVAKFQLEPAPLPNLLPYMRKAPQRMLRNLKYLYLGHWNILWDAFVGATPGTKPEPSAPGAPPPYAHPSLFIFDSLQEINFWECTGLPKSPPGSGTEKLKWLSDLEQSVNREIQGMDETRCGSRGIKAMNARNIGGGDW